MRSYTASSTDLNVYCDTGDIATGGGVGSTANVNVRASRPHLDTSNVPYGWFGRFQTADASNTVYVICHQVSAEE